MTARTGATGMDNYTMTVRIGHLGQDCQNRSIYSTVGAIGLRYVTVTITFG